MGGLNNAVFEGVNVNLEHHERRVPTPDCQQFQSWAWRNDVLLLSGPEQSINSSQAPSQQIKDGAVQLNAELLSLVLLYQKELQPDEVNKDHLFIIFVLHFSVSWENIHSWRHLHEPNRQFKRLPVHQHGNKLLHAKETIRVGPRPWTILFKKNSIWGLQSMGSTFRIRTHDNNTKWCFLIWLPILVFCRVTQPNRLELPFLPQGVWVLSLYGGRNILQNASNIP